MANNLHIIFKLVRLTDSTPTTDTVEIESAFFEDESSTQSMIDRLIEIWKALCRNRSIRLHRSRIYVEHKVLYQSIVDAATKSSGSRTRETEDLFTDQFYEMLVTTIIFMTEMATAYVPEDVGMEAIRWFASFNLFPLKYDNHDFVYRQRFRRTFSVGRDKYASPTGIFGWSEYDPSLFKHGCGVLISPFHVLIGSEMQPQCLSIQQAVDAISWKLQLQAHFAKRLGNKTRWIMPFLNPYVVLGIVVSRRMYGMIGPNIEWGITAMQLYIAQLILNFAFNDMNYGATDMGGVRARAFWMAACNPPYPQDYEHLNRYSMSCIQNLYRYEGMGIYDHKL